MKKQLSRAKKIIENDRLGLVCGSEEIIRSDLENLLREYFSLTEPVKIEFSRTNDKIEITISATCSGVKRFIAGIGKYYGYG